MKPEYVLVEDGTPHFFSSLELARSYVEPIDVRNGEYRLFDLDGNRLGLEVVSERKSGLRALLGSSSERIVITEGRAERGAPEELAQVLEVFLQRIGKAGGLSSLQGNARLDRLLTLAAESADLD